MEAGLLNRIITIEKPVLSVDEYGSETLEWQTLKQTRSSVKIDSGNRINSNNEIVHDYNLTFSIRYYHNEVDETCRIIFNNRKYRILSIFPDKSLQRLIIATETINE